MKYLVKPRHIAKYFYSTSDGKRTRANRKDDPEPYDLLSDQEIEFEVIFAHFVQSPLMKKYFLGRRD